MKREEILNSIKESVRLGKRYINFEIEFLKLSLSEKISLILAGVGLAFLLGMLFLFTIFMASMALAVTFKDLMTPWLAYLCVAAIYLILGLIIFLLRKQLIINPIVKFISKIIIDHKSEHHEQGR